MAVLPKVATGLSALTVLFFAVPPPKAPEDALLVGAHDEASFTETWDVRQDPSLSSALGSALLLIFGSCALARVLSSSQRALLAALIAREACDVLLLLGSWLAAPDAKAMQLTAAMLLSLAGSLGAYQRLQRHPRRWADTCWSCLLFFSGLALGIQQFWNPVCLVEGVVALFAATCVHAVPLRALIVEWPLGNMCTSARSCARRLARLLSRNTNPAATKKGLDARIQLAQSERLTRGVGPRRGWPPRLQHPVQQSWRETVALSVSKRCPWLTTAPSRARSFHCRAGRCVNRCCSKLIAAARAAVAFIYWLRRSTVFAMSLPRRFLHWCQSLPRRLLSWCLALPRKLLGGFQKQLRLFVHRFCLDTQPAAREAATACRANVPDLRSRSSKRSAELTSDLKGSVTRLTKKFDTITHSPGVVRRAEASRVHGALGEPRAAEGPVLQRRRNSGSLRDSVPLDVGKKRVSSELPKDSLYTKAKTSTSSSSGAMPAPVSLSQKDSSKENVPFERQDLVSGMEKEFRPRRKVAEVVRQAQTLQEVKGSAARCPSPIDSNLIVESDQAAASSSSLPVFVDEEFAAPSASGDHAEADARGGAAEVSAAMVRASELLAGFITNGHQATAHALGRRLFALRAFKRHLAAGDARAALTSISSCSDCWSQADIHRFGWVFDDAKLGIAKMQPARAAELCKVCHEFEELFSR